MGKKSVSISGFPADWLDCPMTGVVLSKPMSVSKSEADKRAGLAKSVTLEMDCSSVTFREFFEGFAADAVIGVQATLRADAVHGKLGATYKVVLGTRGSKTTISVATMPTDQLVGMMTREQLLAAAAAVAELLKNEKNEKKTPKK